MPYLGIHWFLYLVKHSQPDIVNNTRELIKCMDKPTPAAYKELMRLIQFVVDIETVVLGRALIQNKTFMASRAWSSIVIAIGKTIKTTKFLSVV